MGLADNLRHEGAVKARILAEALINVSDGSFALDKEELSKITGFVIQGYFTRETTEKEKESPHLRGCRQVPCAEFAQAFVEMNEHGLVLHLKTMTELADKHLVDLAQSPERATLIRMRVLLGLLDGSGLQVEKEDGGSQSFALRTDSPSDK